MTPEYCERAGRGQASLSLSPPQPLYLFCARLFGFWGCFQLVLLEGGLSRPKPLPEEARPAGSPPDPRLDLFGAGKGTRREANGGCQRRSCRPAVRAQEAGSSAQPAPQLRARCRWSLPSRPNALARATHCPRSPGCAVAPRPWLRAGGGRRRKKSCESAASLVAHAAPGAAPSRATRLQVRPRGAGTRGRQGWGAPGPSCPLMPCGARRLFSLHPGGDWHL